MGLGRQATNRRTEVHYKAPDGYAILYQLREARMSIDGTENHPTVPFATNADFDRWAPMLEVIRRLIVAGSKKGRRWDKATNVGEISKATRTSPDEVVRLIRSCGWLVEVIEDTDKPIADWGVYEDGE